MTIIIYIFVWLLVIFLLHKVFNIDCYKIKKMTPKEEKEFEIKP